MRYAILISALLLVATTSASAGLINGDFETGDLTGWTLFDTAHGGTNLADVVLFDTAGTGTPSNSAQFQVGQTSGIIGPGGSPEGAGIEQTVNLNAGTLNVFFDIAESSDAVNGDGGTFELLLINGTVVASDAFGIVGSGVERATLTYSGDVPGGPTDIGIAMTRDFGIGVPGTPIQYLDNIQISGSAVPLPEPSAAGLTLAGAAIALGIRRRRPAAR